MSKTVIGVVLTILAAGLLGGFMLLSNSKEDNDHTNHSPDTPHNESVAQTDNISANSTDQSSQAVQTMAVDIKNYAYTPQKIQVKKGSAVTWTNQDSAEHDIAPDQSSADFKGSQLLAKGESYTYTFNKVGTYSYHCSPHPYMKATVEVIE